MAVLASAFGGAALANTDFQAQPDGPSFYEPVATPLPWDVPYDIGFQNTTTSFGEVPIMGFQNTVTEALLLRALPPPIRPLEPMQTVLPNGATVLGASDSPTVLAVSALINELPQCI